MTVRMAPARKKQRLSAGMSMPLAEEETETLPRSDLSPEKRPAEVTELRSKETPQQASRSLFVRRLPPGSTSESLAQLFSESYPVKHAVAVTDPATKQCRGFGFVTFADAEDAQRAKTEFGSKLIEGRKLRIEIADPRERDAKDGVVSEAKAKREREKAEAQQPPKLIVRNLPWTIKSSDQLSKLFLSYGKVKQAYLPKRNGGLLPGFGFVLMRGRKNAEKAIAGVNGKEIDGRAIAVDWAVDKEIYQQAAKSGEQVSAGEPGSLESGNDEDATEDAIKNDLENDIENDLENDIGDEAEDSISGDDQDGEDSGVDLEVEDADHDKSGFETQSRRTEDRSTTLFVRNLPFTCTDEDLEDQFSVFGGVRYARVVIDFATERSKGTGFVCFYATADSDTCLREAPSRIAVPTTTAPKEGQNLVTHSILQNADSDLSGKYTMDGRILQVSRAVDKSEANKLTEEGVASRNHRDRDKRRLYLLSEGTISTRSKLWESLPPSEQTMREASMKQRKILIESNPSLHLSLTRLSVRNIPRTIGSKELKALAREAVVGFATDQKEGKRQRLSHEELERGGEEMAAADRARKAAGKGVVKQAKVVFEGEGGSKVSESTGAGRSRGYGFIEFYTHRNALMGLRWLNGHSVDYRVKDTNAKSSRDAVQDRKKRLIVEFAIENAQVVLRRKEREQKARERSKAVQEGRLGGDSASGVGSGLGQTPAEKREGSKKRKRDRRAPSTSRNDRSTEAGGRLEEGGPMTTADDKTAQRNRIIGRKRAMRRTRRGEKS